MIGIPGLLLLCYVAYVMSKKKPASSDSPGSEDAPLTNETNVANPGFTAADGTTGTEVITDIVTVDPSDISSEIEIDLAAGEGGPIGAEWHDPLGAWA